ncbi:DNA primase [Streptomyces sp. Ru73]|uniref:bifunctional DNA primase/polymerase n=1 Tax=Streptomyces sp. Ru73 TaxID=2080748 RepID=UPI000CDE1301|nr:bifunctional DNA primase/polymerase [Streptomyces sp. Ru73]POX39485.1 DNA primase [Streptomyces sp. Ru73]
MEQSSGVTGTPQVPQQRGERLLDIAVRYAAERHWDVLPGAWLEDDGATTYCSCGARDCRTPGAHPLATDWTTAATGSASVIHTLWTEHPRASILLPTGRTFDALDVPETAGCLALARLERRGLPLGPVIRTPDRRMLFLVLPGAATKVPDLVRKLGWSSPAGIGLRLHGEGTYLPAPPTRTGRYAPVQWAVPPTPANRWLPDTEDLLSPLAYACGREAAMLRMS